MLTLSILVSLRAGTCSMATAGNRAPCSLSSMIEEARYMQIVKESIGLITADSVSSDC